MFFRLTNLPVTFQVIINNLLKDIIKARDIAVFIDNMMVGTVSGAVHTRGESLQDRLRDIWTCRMTLASAYMLYHLSAVWLQLQMIGRSLRWE